MSYLQPMGMRKHEDRLFITFHSNDFMVLQHGESRWAFKGESVSEYFMSFLEGWRQSWTEYAVQIWPPAEEVGKRGLTIDRALPPRGGKSYIVVRISGREGLTYLRFSDKEVARAVKEIRDLDKLAEERRALDASIEEEDAQLERDRLDAIKWREQNEGKSE